MFATAERTVAAANRVAVAMTLRVLLKSWILNKSRFQSFLAGQSVNRLRNPTKERAELMASARPVSRKLCQHYDEVIKRNLIVSISMRTIFCAPTRWTCKAAGINHTSSRCIWKKVFQLRKRIPACENFNYNSAPCQFPTEQWYRSLKSERNATLCSNNGL